MIGVDFGMETNFWVEAIEQGIFHCCGLQLLWVWFMLEFFPYNLKSSNSLSFLDELCGFTYFDSVKNITFELIVLLIEKNKKNLISRNPD